MRRRGISGYAAAALAIAAFALLLGFSDDAFLMIGGSESTSFLVAPHLGVQLVCLAVFAIALLAPARGLLLGLRVALALLALVLGGHRLVVDHVREELRDVYLAVPVSRLKLDPALEGGLRTAFSDGGVTIGQVGAGPSIWVFSPAWIGLDRRMLRTAS
jgi:hypothetical protein